MYASLNRIASSIVAFTLLALAAHTLASLVWGLYDSQLAGSQQITVESNNPKSELSLSDLPTNFFSRAPSSTATTRPKPDLDKIDKTQLRLTLKGVLATPNNAVVIIDTGPSFNTFTALCFLLLFQLPPFSISITVIFSAILSEETRRR